MTHSPKGKFILNLSNYVAPKKILQMKNILCISSILCLFYASAFAQTDTLADAQMEKLGVKEIISGKSMTETKVVGASRSERTLADLPVTVYIISQEDIFKNGYTTLVDVLKMVPGVRVSKVGNGVSGETFLLRGLEGNVYTKILLNNLPIQPTVSSILSIGEQLPIAQVERIEVIYGPSSAVYGADAMAGVINIITKSTQNSSFATINALVGEYGYRHINLMAGGKLGSNKNILQYNFYANQGTRQTLNITQGKHKRVFSPLRYFSNIPDNMTDEELENLAKTPPNDVLIRRQLYLQAPYYQGSYANPSINNLPQSSYLLGFQLKYRNFQFSYNEMYRQDHSSLGRNPLFFGYQNPENFIGEKVQVTALNYTNSWKKLTFTSNLMYLRERYDTQSSLATNYDNNGKAYLYQASDDIFGEVLINYNLTKKWELTSGVSYKVASSLPQTRDLATPFNPSDYEPFTNKKPKPDPLFGNFGINPVTSNNFGAFLQGYFSSKKWNVVIGIRFDSPSNYLARSYQRIAALYKLSSKTSIRTSIGYAFKAPTLNISYQSVALTDRYLDTLNMVYKEPNGKIAYQVLPSPDLAPEESGSIDIGFRYVPNPNIYIDITGFFTSVNNLIVAVPDTVNKKEYPLAQERNTVRRYRNNSNTVAGIIGLQLVLRAKNLIPAIGLHTNFAYTNQAGSETLGDNKGEVQYYRQVPIHTLQWGISLNPIKKLYINFDNVAMSGWYPKFINPNIDLSRQFIAGYYTLDMVTRYTFSKNISAFVKIMNVFDAEYGGLSATGLDVDLKYMPQMGRNIQFGVSFKME